MSFFYLANGIKPITSKVIRDKLLIHKTKKPENKKTDIPLISVNIPVKTEFLKKLEEISLGRHEKMERLGVEPSKNVTGNY